MTQAPEYANKKCVLCGEKLGDEQDIGEMHGEYKPLFGIEGGVEVSNGLVHASCGIEQGWEVS